MTRRRLLGLSTAIGITLACVALAFLVRLVAQDWGEVRASLGDARVGWIVFSVLLASLGMTAIAVPWRSALRLLGSDLSYPGAVARYYVGEIGKYLPGGLWPVVGRGELAARAGVPRAAAYSSVALSLGVLYLSAMFLVVLGLPWMIAGDSSLAYLWVLIILPSGVLCLHPAVLGRVRSVLERLTHRDLEVAIPPWRASLALLGQYIPAWLFIGTATWALAQGLGHDVGWGDVAPAAVLSWVVGFVLVPVPGGVGVREAAFVALVSGLDPGVAATVALLARVLFVFIDGLGFALASAWLAKDRLRAAPVEPDSHPPVTQRAAS